VTFFLGIDGGGTKTRCLLGDENSVLASGTGSGCSVLRVGEACARDSLAGAIHEACVQGGISPRQVTRTCAGIAGAGDDGIASLLQRLLIEIIGGAIEVIGDMEVALESAFGGGPGIVVIAGTGSIVFGRNERGETSRAGGWGRILCDEGSAHWIVIKAIHNSLHALDRGCDSRLLNDLLAFFDLRTPSDLVVYAGGSPTPEFAPALPVVRAAAERGDDMACAVLRSAGVELAGQSCIAAQRLFQQAREVPIATHGGVFAASTIVRSAFTDAVLENCPRARVLDVVVDPALGALERARRDFGIWHKPPQ
jgi:N-acetylglucosamine kinase-like BadF-type ATPase